MASTYALPASAMTNSHNHHGHGHLHSHSHSHSASPSRHYSANTPRSMKHERSSGSLHSHHSHTISEPQFDHHHGHSHSHNPPREKFEYLPTPPDSNGMPAAPFGKHPYSASSELTKQRSHSPPPDAVDVVSHGHDHVHTHGASGQPRSKFTAFVLPYAQKWPLLHSILAEKDSRRIFYFILLNFTFMIVQACYGFLTNSLGLLSDSIHMFFDCLALGVGLFASIAAKWPPSQRFPYGFGKIESLSGFGNGVFLMLISIEITIEAIERIADGRETKRLAELFLVSSAGLAVNLVGMACFGHHGGAGHGHDHGHSHSHSHPSEKSHSHDDGHNCDHDHDHHDHHEHESHAALLDSPASKAHSHGGHSHSHENENMHGIFLHVLADTMGSAAVMVSTALMYFVGWNGWDPLASCIIAFLIFASAIPLIKSSAKKLLLTIPDDVEYNLRDTLAGVSNLRGVASYNVSRFWMGDKNVENKDEHVLGVMHIIATRGSDLDDVKERATDFLTSHGVDAVVQVELIGDTSCWCGGSSGRSPSRFS